MHKPSQLKSITHSNEIWEDVLLSDGFYQVSNLGNVKRIKRVITTNGKTVVIYANKQLTPYVGADGYLFVKVRRNGKLKRVGVSRLVAESFIPNDNGYDIVDHINRDRKDNRVSNLRWVNSRLNSLNKNNNHLLTHKGITATISEWAMMTGIPSKTLYQRCKYGWDDDMVVSTPVNTKYHKKGVSYEVLR